MPGVKGRGGPKPKPTKILELRQSRWAKSRPEEPQPVPVLPPCPAYLDARAKQTWHRLAKHLHAMGILGDIDQPALARYCVLHWRWRDVEAALTAQGLMTVPEDADGAMIEEASKYVSLSLNYADRLLRLEQQFGMTPSSRAAIGLALAGQKKRVSNEAAENPKNKGRFFRSG